MTTYLVEVRNKNYWQQPVEDKDLNDPPAEPSKGDRYIVGDTPTGAWDGHAEDIAYYDGAAWQFITKAEGQLVYVKDEDEVYAYATSWVAYPVELKNLTTHEIQQYENLGEVTTISAAQWGYVGALTTHPIGGDGTAGRIRRQIKLLIANGTNASTLKCTIIARWNGDTIAETDNIAKDATTGNFTLDANGKVLLVEASGLAGNCVSAFGFITRNASGTDLNAEIFAISNDIRIAVFNSTADASLDMTVLVDTGAICAEILYVTDA